MDRDPLDVTVEFIAICRYKFTEKKNKKQNVNLILLIYSNNG